MSAGATVLGDGVLAQAKGANVVFFQFPPYVVSSAEGAPSEKNFYICGDLPPQRFALRGCWPTWESRRHAPCWHAFQRLSAEDQARCTASALRGIATSAKSGRPAADGRKGFTWISP